MKYKLLSVSKYSQRSNTEIGVNIGDYVQALAASQFLPKIDGFLDRDEDLKSYTGERCKMIMNGWYMHDPTNWPPSESIIPLFVAFHLNSTVEKEMLSSESIDYLKSKEPIGCRDNRTMRLLQKAGIDAYFSGCLTLTLGRTYRTSNKTLKIYIVDPAYPCSFNLRNFFEALSIFLACPKDVVKLLRNKNLLLHNGRNAIMKFIKTSLYYKEYSRVFTRDVVMEAEYVLQDDDHFVTDFKDDEARLAEAERLIRLYASAAMVITTRIHCALPCLGLETPVVYIDRVLDTEESKCRLDGLKELFNVVKIEKGKLTPEFIFPQSFDPTNLPKNKDHWRGLATKLIDRCINFIKSNEDSVG